MLKNQKRQHIKQDKQKAKPVVFDDEKFFTQITSKSKKRTRIDILNNDEKIRQQKKKIKKLKKKLFQIEYIVH